MLDLLQMHRDIEAGAYQPIAGRINYGVRMTAEQAKEIRELYVPGRHGKIAYLADAFGVSRQTITNIVKGVSWKNAGGPIKGVDY